jgi:hypothetical protein
MGELFDDDDKALVIEDDLMTSEVLMLDTDANSISNARRRLERIIEEKRLRDELDDFFNDL